ncbi:Hsp20/alpha crystallin family protein [Leptolyngbya cf. ectocarpi LEGE 11479]|uniref:Hsp20/alpha crystallin family protein n=1 Tax=Leptolyngbya cf. ectocarpi LEGE 11479 TaxID=1828722 RepID=A0A928ZUV9_LEPEC|nr:Hsp20/alpha crystallin family protein [Leptolyngbya ectocarpi]MBE9067886.1 Hsp20/alpha crystallin family protein [Leptolyngbya cf. ectocarpi LEGE 11479]
MAIIRLEPFNEADTARYRLDKLFDGMDATRVSSWTRQENWLPAVEIRETDEVVKLQIALPGLEANDIEVHVSQGAVLISGDYRPAEKQDGEHLISSEFLYGSFRRVIPLDTKVKNKEAKADMRNGMLMLTIPKADDERDRVFRVSLSEPQAAQPVAVS